MRRVEYRGMKLILRPCDIEPDTHTWIETDGPVGDKTRQDFANLVWGCTSRRVVIEIRRVANPSDANRHVERIPAGVIHLHRCWQRFSNGSALARRLKKKGII